MVQAVGGFLIICISFKYYEKTSILFAASLMTSILSPAVEHSVCGSDTPSSLSDGRFYTLLRILEDRCLINIIIFLSSSKQHLIYGSTSAPTRSGFSIVIIFESSYYSYPRYSSVSRLVFIYSSIIRPLPEQRGAGPGLARRGLCIKKTKYFGVNNKNVKGWLAFGAKYFRAHFDRKNHIINDSKRDDCVTGF